MSALFPQQSKPKIPVYINHKAGPCIALSGKSGCGNSTVSAMLAEQLHLPLINYTFRNLAQDIGYSMESLSKKANDDISIDWHIEARQIQSMQEGPCILASRMAIWLVHGKVLRVYLQASADVRAARIAKREDKSLELAYTQTVTRDSEDSRRIHRHYDINIDDYQQADCIINTDNMQPKEITEKIRAKLKEKAGNY